MVGIGTTNPTQELHIRGDLRLTGTIYDYLNPNEIIANNTMVLQSFATNTKNLGNVMNKNQILKGLDDVINFAKGSSSKLSDDAYRLLGYYDTNISNHFQNMATNPAEYRKLLSKLAQQAAYLKSQVKIAM